MLGGALALAACLALPGCISLGAKPPEQLIRLTPDDSAPAGTQVSGQVADAIVVLDPDFDRSLDTPRVPVKIDASSLSYLKDAFWTERPARQMRTLLAETLRARTGKLVVVGGDFETTGRTLIGGRLLDMGYDVPTRSVIVRFDATRTERGGPITTRRFEAAVPNVKPDVADVAPALNRAANDVAKQVADWVKGEATAPSAQYAQ
nr:ABC-type transport auxiliary lipoprotein family protein [Novosphingobium sp. PhB165]